MLFEEFCCDQGPPKHALKLRELVKKIFVNLMVSLRKDELAAQLAPGANKSIPTNRTETPEESLEESILSILTSSNTTNLTKETLDEAFCRDVEAFSEAFQVNF